MSDHGESFCEEIKSALSDIGVLLEYMGRQPEAKLQSYFHNVKNSSEVAVATVKPPSKTYSQFLNRISAIQEQFSSTGKISGGEHKDSIGLTDVAFVLWARDFLSVLSAPSTATSIRITNAYMKQRFVLKQGELDQYQLSAAKTVSTVKRIQNFGVTVAIFIVIISVYALSGHQILSAKLATQAALKEISEKIELTQRQESNPTIVNPALIDYLNKPYSTGDDGNGASEIKSLVNVEHKRPTSGKFFLCDNIDVTPFYPLTKVVGEDTKQFDIGTPSNGPRSTGRYYYYGSLDEITLCNERRSVLRQLLAISDELISWQRTITNPLPDFRSITSPDDSKKGVPSQLEAPIQVASANADPTAPQNTETQAKQSARFNIGDVIDLWFVIFVEWLKFVASIPGLVLGYLFGEVLGKSSIVSSELSTKEICMSFLGTSGDSRFCADRLTEMVEYFGTIPDSILGCINLYVLPCLFAFLGSVTAGVKYITQRIDRSLLNFTDRGRLLQNQVLGLIAGSVIGLFATYLLKANQGLETLGVSGVAFLAGYNVPALFQLFDDLSARLFLTSQPK